MTELICSVYDVVNMSAMNIDSLLKEKLSVSGNIHHKIKKVYFVQHPPCDCHHSLQKFTPRQP